MDKNDMGALCAWMTLATVKERVENKRTSPEGGFEAGVGCADG
jgi:hypothetical protein